MENKNLPELFLRIGIALAFLYPPISALFDPYSWIAYFPKFIHGLIPDLVLLHSFGIIEVALGLWILSGKKIAYPSFAAAAILIAIVTLNLSQFEIVFRDLSIAAMAVALGLFHWREKAKEDASP